MFILLFPYHYPLIIVEYIYAMLALEVVVQTAGSLNCRTIVAACNYLLETHHHHSIRSHGSYGVYLYYYQTKFSIHSMTVATHPINYRK